MTISAFCRTERDKQPVRNPGMNNIDDDTEQAAMATADEWFEAFAHSPAFARLTESQQRQAGAITEYFARYTYTHVGLSPRQWDGPAIVECCTDILPPKISADLDFFSEIGRAHV